MKRAVLACSGLDKVEGSVAREVALRLAEETGAEVVCPVLLHRSPTRYKQVLAENGLIVVDGCATRCATRLAAEHGAKVDQRLVVSEVAKRRGLQLSPGLRLGPGELDLAEALVQEILAEEAAGQVEAPPAAVGQVEQPTRYAAQPAAVPAEEAEIPAAAVPTWEPPADFIVVVYEKYEFRIPRTGYWFNENDVWVRPAGKVARVGISDYMQQRLTDINYFEPPELGTTVEQFGELGTVESTKAVFEVVSPVTGIVRAVNQEVMEAPELVNEDPYGRGWLVEVELTNWEEDSSLLIDAAAYAASVERKAAED